jgi:hypothetical protein
LTLSYLRGEKKVDLPERNWKDWSDVQENQTTKS